MASPNENRRTSVDTTMRLFRAKDVKEKLGFLRRRHTDSALHGETVREMQERDTRSSGSSVRPSREVALTWADDLDNLLHDKCKLINSSYVH